MNLNETFPFENDYDLDTHTIQFLHYFKIIEDTRMKGGPVYRETNFLKNHILYFTAAEAFSTHGSHRRPCVQEHDKSYINETSQYIRDTRFLILQVIYFSPFLFMNQIAMIFVPQDLPIPL